MMNLFRNIIIAFILLISFAYGINDVEAKEIAKTCNYSYTQTIYKNTYVDAGYSVTNTPNAEGGTIVLNIYTDGSQSGTGKSNGSFLAEDFGGDEKILNWGKSDNGASDIKSTECPEYIGVIVQGFGDRKWYGFSSGNLLTEGITVADKDNSDSMWVLKNDGLADNTYICNYDHYNIVVDAETKTLSAEGTWGPLIDIFYFISNSLKESWFSEYRGTDKCLATVACYDNSFSLNTSTYYYIYNDEMEAKADNNKLICNVKPCTGDDCSDVVQGNACLENTGFSSSCITYNKYINEIEAIYAEIESGSSDEGSLYNKANAKIQQLGALCKGVMASYDYSYPCVQACVNIERDIAALKTCHGIDQIDSGSGNRCFLSARVINWILKVIRWIRYIVPVLLIILSILDFIKAIASDSDDEMKKVGGKFAKRLIAAALIFIVPLILEFILDVFGITANGFCL